MKRRTGLFRGRRGCDAGFTLVEMVTCVVVMGLVIGPLAMAMMQVLNVAPQSNARSKLAVNAEQVSSWFTEDITNADDFVGDTPTTGTLPAYGYTKITCGQTPGFLGIFIAPEWGAVSTFWQLVPSPAVNGFQRVALRRNNGSTWTEMLSGYCVAPVGATPGSTVAEVWRTVPTGTCTSAVGPTTTVPNCYPGAQYEHVRLSLHLRTEATLDSPEQVLNFEVTRGESPA
jgi:prepilin-type N-terminal cleavage/methylation domain-containing protein